MSEETAVAFLRALARALSVMSLYGEGHAARSEALDRAHGMLRKHLDATSDGSACFSFLDGEVIHDDLQIRRLRDWQWSRLLPAVGVERIVFEAGVRRAELAELLHAVRDRLDGETLREAASRGPTEPDGATRGEGPTGERGGADGRSARTAAPYEQPDDPPRADVIELEHVRFGPIRRDETGQGQWGGQSASVPYDLDEELEAVGWLMEKAGQDRAISGLLAGAVVKSISVALREEESALRLLAPLKAVDEYTTVHSMNTAILSMGTAEALGWPPDRLHTVGEAALLHDTGKTRVPRDILKKQGPLSDEEWEVVRKHPTEGARILMNSERDMEAPALVAYEHHLWWDGSAGYPELRYPRKSHPLTQIVRVCDIYDALRTDRPYRPGWAADEVESYLRAQEGTRFAPRYVNALLDLMGTTDRGGGASGGDRPTEASSGQFPEGARPEPER